MRILLVAKDADGSGGTERTALLAAEQLRARGHVVHFLHGSPGRVTAAAIDGDISEPEFFDFRARVRPLAIQQAAARVGEYLRHNSIEIVHVHGLPRVGLRRNVAHDRPLVITAHNVECPNGARYQWGTRTACERAIGIGCYTTGFRTLGCGHLGNGAPMSPQGFALSAFRSNRNRREWRAADAVIAPSTWMSSYLRGEAVAAQRLHVVPPPIEVSVPAAAAVVGDASQLPVVAFVGRLVAIKGVDVLLRASALTRVPHRLVIAGEGAARPDLELLSRELGISGRTSFVGRVSPAQADALRATSALVAVPSTVPETFGMVGPEALLAGIPVVAHDYAGTSDWLAIGGRLANGVALRDVAAFSAAMTDVLAHPPTAVERRQAAAAVAQRYSVRTHVDSLLAVYQSVCR